jgi:dipeptidyl-peptidase 4
MMKKYQLLCLVLFLVQVLVAQKKVLKIEDTANPALRPKGLTMLQWNATGDAYTFVEKDNLVWVDAASGTKTTKLTLAKFNESLKTISEAEVKNFPNVEWKEANVFTFLSKNKKMQYDITTGAIKTLCTWKEEAENIDFANNGNIAYTVKGNLFIQKKDDNKVVWQSKEDGYNVVVGESVHRQEFGIEKGIFWSPKGNRLAFYRMDQSMVTDYPLADYRERTAKGRNIKYPMAGEKSHHVTIGVWNGKKNKVKYINTGEPAEQYLTNISWSPDEQFLYIQVVNRDQNHAKLNCYDVKTGQLVKTLIEEKHDKYVEPQHGITFLPNTPNQFIHQSQRDGYNHLYLYDTEGRQISQLTKGNWIVTELLGFDADGITFNYTSTEVSPLETHAYKINLSTGEKYKLTKDIGTHSVQIAKNGNILDYVSNQKTPLKILFTDMYGRDDRTVYLQSSSLLSEYETGEISLLTLKAADGVTDLHARIIKPANFDPTKKYPVLHYVYNGPHVQLVKNTWLAGADMFMVYMASQGYIVFTIDGRGSANRGRDFENAIHRQCGVAEVEDQMIGVNYVKNLPYADADRMVCFGWSYGGFMTTSLMLKKPDAFKVGIAGGPVIDWKYYEVMYTERYMDTPQQNPEGYKNAALTNFIPNLKGKLMIIQGLEDDTVVPQHCYSFVNECVAKGVVIDFFPYPNHPHNVRGKDRVHLYKKIYDYILMMNK